MRTSTHEEVGSDMAANELSALLWKERELLELLLFKLEEEQLLLIAGKSRWISHATREVEQVIERMRAVGLARTVEVAALAEEWGIGPDATLRELVAAAPDGIWSDIFGVAPGRADRAHRPDRRGARHQRAPAARGRPLDAGDAELAVGRRRRPGHLRRGGHRQPGRHGTLLRHGGLTAMSTFSGLNTAYTGLVAAKAGLDVVGQNLVNANTQGYTRQRVSTSGVPALNATGLFTRGRAPRPGRQRRRHPAPRRRRDRRPRPQHDGPLRLHERARRRTRHRSRRRSTSPAPTASRRSCRSSGPPGATSSNQAGEQAPAGVLLGQAGSARHPDCRPATAPSTTSGARSEPRSTEWSPTSTPPPPRSPT